MTPSPTMIGTPSPGNMLAQGPVFRQPVCPCAVAKAHLFQLMVSDGWSWVASVPTLLSHEALNQLLTPGMHARATASSGATALCCPIERFLGCVFFGDTCTGFSSQRKARKLPLQATTSRVGSDDDLIHCSIFC